METKLKFGFPSSSFVFFLKNFYLFLKKSTKFTISTSKTQFKLIYQTEEFNSKSTRFKTKKRERERESNLANFQLSTQVERILYMVTELLLTKKQHKENLEELEKSVTAVAALVVSFNLFYVTYCYLQTL